MAASSRPGGVLAAIRPHHEPVAGLAASVLCVEATPGGIDNSDTFSRRPAPGASRFVEPPAALEALVSSVYLRAGGNGILDVVPAPAEGTGSACAVPVVIRWAGGRRPPIRSAHTEISPALHGVYFLKSGLFQHFILLCGVFSRSKPTTCPVAYIGVYATGGLKISIGISWYPTGKIKTM